VDGRSGVVFDGVLYDREDLRGRLGTAVNRVDDDAGLVLEAYRRWGDRVFAELRGFFALILWDERREVLLCARDPLGVHPLFYARSGPELLLSPSADALVRQPGVSRRVDRAALARYLCRRWDGAEETFFGEVRRVLPGHVLHVGRDGSRTYRYWDPSPGGQEVEWVRDGAPERFEAGLARAVDRCVPRDPVGIFLSGGLDSVTVAALATDRCRRAGQPSPLALSLVFPHPDCNEETIQRSVARGLDLPQVVLPFDEAVGSRGLMLAGLETSAGLPAPLQNVWAPAYWALAREARRQGCGNILTGGGGDEWLGVTPVYAADLLRVFDVVGLYRLVTTLQRSYRRPRLALARNVLWTNGARLLLGELLRGTVAGALLRRVRRRVQRWNGAGAGGPPAWMVPDPALRREIDQTAGEQPPNERAGAAGSFYVRELRRALDHPLTALEFEEIFETGQRLGPRILQPFWDADLVELLYRTPPEVLNLGERSKGLVRTMLARRFPHAGFERQRKVVSFDFFGSRVFHEHGRAWSLLGGVPTLESLGLVDAPRLGGGLARMVARGRPHDATVIWDVLNLEAWARAHV